MGFRSGPIIIGLMLVLSGAVAFVAWQNALWANLVATLLMSAWLILLLPHDRRHLSVKRGNGPGDDERDADDALALRILLDRAPTPLVGVQHDTVRALNRAARALFATDDRILSPPEALFHTNVSHFRHEGRGWRIDRAEVLTGRVARRVLALIDIEAEERAAEERASAEMIAVLGHELLNGLAPIASLAESGLAVLADARERDRLLPEILRTLARRAEGLQRFTQSYRALARLPQPVLAHVPLASMMVEWARLFAARWGDKVALRYDPPDDDTTIAVDRDQLTQAIWASLQNGAEAALTGAGAPWVALAVRHEPSVLTIVVSDSGAGIAPDQRGQIFRPFHTTKADGTGIGLSLARQIARAHGGDLALRDGHPTTFVLSIPKGSLQEIEKIKHAGGSVCNHRGS